MSFLWSVTCGQFPKGRFHLGILFVSTFVLKGKKKKQEEWAQKMFEERNKLLITEKIDDPGAQPRVFCLRYNDNDFLCK